MTFEAKMKAFWADVRKGVEPKMATLKAALKLREERRTEDGPKP